MKRRRIFAAFYNKTNRSAGAFCRVGSHTTSCSLDVESPTLVDQPSCPGKARAVNMHTGNGGGSAAASALPPMPLLPITSKQTVHNCKDYVPTNDVFIASYPKSGTTWLQNVLYQLISKTELPLSHISDYAPFYEVDRTWEGSQIAPHYREGHTRLGRAIFNTHLRWDMMPTDGCPDARYIYVVRNAKDACVSFYHHLTNQTLEDGGYEGSWDMFVEDWCAGNVPFGSWVDHLLSWSEALKDPRVLLLQYEDLKTDLEGCVRKIMAHCDLTLTPTQLETALSRMSFEYMSKNHELYQPRSVVWKDPSFRFIRKGQVGDHRAMFEDRHHERFANMLQDRLGGAEPPQLIKSKV